jgi:hypothetical protein
MKMQFLRVIPLLLATGSAAMAQASLFTNFIRQVQMPTGVQWDATVAPIGEQLSALSIDPGGARFELWTVQTSPLKAFLLDTRYVGAYVPMAQVVITSEDNGGMVPRTRADRPFSVQITVGGLLTGDDVPNSSTKVKFLRHVQSYGIGGTGENIDRTQASLIAQSMLSANGTQVLTFTLNSIPFADRSKVRGEERFSFFSLADYQAPESQLASQFIQIWPVADGSIAGITPNQRIRMKLPALTFTLNDLYPSSTTYAQVYKGNAQLGMTGTIVPGSALAVQEAVPQNRVLTVKDYGEVFSAEGRWTMELVTVTAFGMDRLAYVSFDLDRTFRIFGGTTTYE